MTSIEFISFVEFNGWEWVLRGNVKPVELDDAGLAEALDDAQVAFNALENMAPNVEDLEDWDPGEIEGGENADEEQGSLFDEV